MPRLSLIVPFQCDSQALENTLVSVLELRSPDDELLIVHRGVYQDPYGLQGNEAKVLETPASSSLAEQLNIAVQNATGDVLQVVLPGAVLEPDWCVDALAAFDELDVDMIALGVSGSVVSGAGTSFCLEKGALPGFNICLRWTCSRHRPPRYRIDRYQDRTSTTGSPWRGDARTGRYRISRIFRFPGSAEDEA